MAKRRYRKPRCKAKLASGDPCRKVALEGREACGIKAHQDQLEKRKAATPQRGRVRPPKPRRVPAKVIAQQAAFLELFREHGVLSMAAEDTGIDRRRVYEWLEDKLRFPLFAQQFEDAYERATDTLEAAAIERGRDGVEEPVFGSLGPQSGTGVVGTRRVFSDRMLEAALKARRPQHWRERPVQVNTVSNAQVIIELPDNGRARDSAIRVK